MFPDLFYSLFAFQNDNTPWPHCIDLRNGTCPLFETHTGPYQGLLYEPDHVIKIVGAARKNEHDEVSN